MPAWFGYVVIGLVCQWMLIMVLVPLRTGFFLLLLAWAGLRQWRDFPKAPEARVPAEPPVSDST